MDNDTLRIVLASAFGPVVWLPVHWLVDRYRAKHAARDFERRQMQWFKAYICGVRLGYTIRKALRGLRPGR